MLKNPHILFESLRGFLYIKKTTKEKQQTAKTTSECNQLFYFTPTVEVLAKHEKLQH